MEGELFSNEEFRVKFDSRYGTAVTDCHLLANLLDPRYSGKRLSEAERERAVVLMREDCPEFTTLYMKFKTKCPLSINSFLIIQP